MANMLGISEPPRCLRKVHTYLTKMSEKGLLLKGRCSSSSHTPGNLEEHHFCLQMFKYSVFSGFAGHTQLHAEVWGFQRFILKYRMPVCSGEVLVAAWLLNRVTCYILENNARMLIWCFYNYVYLMKCKDIFFFSVMNFWKIYYIYDYTIFIHGHGQDGGGIGFLGSEWGWDAKC